MRRVNEIVFRAAKIGFLKIGIQKFAGPQVGPGKIGTGQIGIHEIRFIYRAPDKFAFFGVQTVKIAQFDAAFLKRQIDKKCVNFGKNHSQQLAVVEFYAAKPAIIDFDIGKIAIQKNAVDEQRPRKFATGKIAFLKSTLREFLAA